MNDFEPTFAELADPVGAAALLGMRLKAARLAQNMTRRALAQKAALSLSTVQRMEEGRGGDIRALLAYALVVGRLSDFDTLLEPGVSRDAFNRALHAKPPRRRASVPRP